MRSIRFSERWLAIYLYKNKGHVIWHGSPPKVHNRQSRGRFHKVYEAHIEFDCVVGGEMNPPTMA